VVEAAQDGDGPHAARRRARCAILRASRDPLRQALLWPVVVAVPRVFAADAPQVAFAQDEDVIEAPLPHAAEEPLAGGVLPGRAIGRP